jgi:hypothetical protein
MTNLKFIVIVTTFIFLAITCTELFTRWLVELKKIELKQQLQLNQIR